MRNALALRHYIDSMVQESPMEFDGVDVSATEFYMDLDNYGDIVRIIISEKRQFRARIADLLKGRYDDDKCEKYEKGILAIKFKGKINALISHQIKVLYTIRTYNYA